MFSEVSPRGGRLVVQQKGLDGCTYTLPNPDLFLYMYVRKEAVLSS